MRTKRADWCDVIASVAWTCGGRDGCTAPGGWHKGNYWVYGDGTYSYDEFSDGDHEDCEESDVPSAQEVAQSWREYAAWVVEHGQDPLGEYFVKQTRKVRERWQFKFRPCIGGVCLVAARHAGRDVSRQRLPEHAARFLDLIPGAACRLSGFASYKDLEAAGVPVGKWHVAHIDREEPNPNYVRELRALARKAARKGEA